VEESEETVSSVEGEKEGPEVIIVSKKDETATETKEKSIEE